MAYLAMPWRVGRHGEVEPTADVADAVPRAGSKRKLKKSLDGQIQSCILIKP